MDTDATSISEHTKTDGDILEFDENGLVPVIAQDFESNDVLMMAYADREAIEHSVTTGRAHYYSRSRNELWKKGETSGNTQKIRDIRVDCDGDAVLYLVEQSGGACHTGHRSCFYRTLDGEDVGEQVFDPDDVY